jgi:hypothetical protein
MVFLYLASYLLFPTSLPVWSAFALVLLLTLAGCYASFELIRRVKWLRPLFGLKPLKAVQHKPSLKVSQSYPLTEGNK